MGSRLPSPRKSVCEREEKRTRVGVYFLLYSALLALFLSRFFEEDNEPEDNELHIYYYRQNRDHQDWNLWIWTRVGDLEGRAFQPITVSADRAHFIIPLEQYRSENELGLLFRKGNWEAKEGEDRFWNPQKSNLIYAVEGEKEFFLQRPRVKPQLRLAFLDSKRLIQVLLPCPLQDKDLSLRKLSVKDSKRKKLKIDSCRILNEGVELEILLKSPLDLSNKDLSLYTVHVEDYKKTWLQPRGILYEPEYYYDVALGLNFEKENIVFRCFAPTASGIEVLLFKHAEGEPDFVFPMQESRPGLWEFNLRKEKGEGWFYKYRCHGSDLINQATREGVDPYSKSHTHRFGRSHIFQDHTPIADPPKFSRDEIVLYEMHLRDFSVHPDSGMSHKGKYASLKEEGTRLKNHSKVKTGLDHLRELGVNTLQILPLQNFDLDDDSKDYDWGYMPCHYFCPHGGYSENPQGIERVSELKQMISTLHENGFKVVLDVVFNHTAEGSGRVISFQALAPHYYYRRDHNGLYFNGSGCGNEFKSEAPMARKLILDSLKYWAKEFKIDGFRFDLMGLMDPETFRRIEEELRAVNPEIILYGEPWAAGKSGIEPLTKGVQKSTQFSVFNDHFRDALRGDNSKWGSGFVQGSDDEIEASKRIPVKEGVSGSVNDFTDSPLESINYVACHDNYTLRDKLSLTTENLKTIDSEKIQKIERILAVLLLTSQGIPFLHCGQEFGRSKGGEHNSYNSPDHVNQVDWNLKETENDLFLFYKDLITLRRQHKIFRLTTREEVFSSLGFVDEFKGVKLPNNILVYLLTNPGLRDSFKKVLIGVNPSDTKLELPLSQGDWMRVSEKKRLSLRISRMKPYVGQSLVIAPWETLILAQTNTVSEDKKRIYI
jgi:pullulanase